MTVVAFDGMLSANATIMNKLITLLTALLPLATFSQLINKGGDIYTQKGALIHQQGAFINGNGATANGSIKNDGIIEVDGDFENAANATFGVHTNAASTDRVVKFTGNGTQAIKGNMSSANSSFYNLVIDKALATDAVEMQTSVNVDGSLVFGTSTTTAAYTPSALYTNNNQKGLIKTYTDTAEYTLAVTNGDVNAIAGYSSLVINGAPTTAYVLTKGTRGSANGGLQRNITSATSYVFPIGTATNGFNAVRINFSNIPAGGGNVIGKFNDGTDGANGAAGTIALQYDAYNGNGYVNPGYNRYFAANPCNNNAPQWLILEDAIVDHGYWSFASNANNRDYKYMVETFPNSFNNSGITSLDVIRTVKYDGAYGFNPSAATWNNFIDSVSTINDLLTYSKNAGCYTEAGIPGGIYTGLAHFSLKGARTSNALPVELLSLKAEPKQSTIEVSWATALELNNRGFEVKRSEDGVNFTTIGWVDGNNNSTVERSYAFTDNHVQANTVYYYRLNQIDNDGAHTESYIVSAAINGGANNVVVSDPMPNPAHNASSLVVTASVSQPVTVKLFDMIGQIVSTDAFTLQAGDNTLSMNIQNFAAGTYNAVLYTADKTFSKKLIVSNN